MVKEEHVKTGLQLTKITTTELHNFSIDNEETYVTAGQLTKLTGKNINLLDMALEECFMEFLEI